MARHRSTCTGLREVGQVDHLLRLRRVRSCMCKVASERGEVMEWMSSTGLRVQNKPTTKRTQP